MSPLRPQAPTGFQHQRDVKGDGAESHAQQEEFLQSLEHDHGLVQLLTMHRRRYRVPVEEMQLFSDHICQICWSKRDVGRKAEVSSNDVQKIQMELERRSADHRRQLAICNLNAMKQLDLAHGGTGKIPDDELVSFYEPMQYLSKEHKDLLLMILVDKLRQICDGTAPTSLLEELQRFSFDSHSLSGLSLGQGQEIQEEEELKASDRKEDDEDAWDRVDAAEAALEVAQRQAEEAKSRVAYLLDELRTLRAAQDAPSAQCLKLEQQLEAACRKLLELGLSLSEIEQLLGLEPGELAHHPGLQVASSDRRRCMEVESTAVQTEAEQTLPQKVAEQTLPQKVDFAGLGDLTVSGSGPQVDGRYPLSGMRTNDGNPIWRREQPDGNGPKLYNAEGVWAITDPNGDVLASSLQMNLQVSPTDDMTWLDGEGKSVPMKVSKAKAKIEEPKEPRGNQRTRKQTTEVEVQTMISGSQVDGWEAENQRLKLALEELQMKVKDLVNKCKQKGIEGVESIAMEMGLKQILRTRACFERLYQDAFRRIDRLEELRRRVRAERAQLLKAVMQDAIGEPSVLSSLVEQQSWSSWPGMSADAAPRENAKKIAGRGRFIDKPDAPNTVLPQIPNSTLRVSSSLPTLGRNTSWRRMPAATESLPQLQARALEPVKPSK